MLNMPQWPDVSGLEDFGGKLFHSARWDSDRDISSSALAIIGSAATAVQMAPELAREAAQLYLYERSATWALPRENEPFTQEELAPFANDPDAALAERERIFNDIDPQITFANRELCEFCEFCEAAGRKHLLVVEDPELRKKLTPQVPWGTQQPLFSATWFPMFNRPNVELVIDPIARITEDSIVSGDGAVRRVDVIIAASGFQTNRFLSTVDVTGRGGLRQLARMDAQGFKRIEVREDVMQRHNEQLQRDLGAVEVWQAECHNYYGAASGRIVTQWPYTMTEYGRRTRLPDPDAYAIG